MSWTRVEPHRQTTDIEAGLAAEIADPLWMLLRQWQFGELTGDDGGSPVAVDVTTSWSRFSRYRAEGGRSTAPRAVSAVPFDPDGMPLEAVVENEPVIRLDLPELTPWTVAVRIGRMLTDRLHHAGLTAAADALATHPATTFAPPPVDPDRAEGATEARYRALLDRAGVTDGAKALSLLRAGALPPELGLADQQQLLTAWAADVEDEWGIADTGTAAAAWIPDRFEYAFSLAAPPLPGTDTEIVLRAAEYDGTGMRWSTLDPAPGQPLGATADGTNGTGQRTVTVLPTPLTFPGMAADRYWQFEDAAVALGTTTNGRTDLARMLVTEFAVVYSPDWFLAPVEVPIGSVARIDRVIVRDTFGVATLIGTAASAASDGAGRHFQPADSTDADLPLLTVLPTAMATVTSEPLEAVPVQRDEMANLAWAIEHTVLGPAGRAVARSWTRSAFELPPTISTEPHELVWRLATPVADTWTPLVAVPGVEPRILRRAAILDTATGATTRTKSALLTEVDDIREEEITSAGVQLRLTDQLARSHDGRPFVWRGREKRTWRGEASSGLRFDATTPPTPA